MRSFAQMLLLMSRLCQEYLDQNRNSKLRIVYGLALSCFVMQLWYEFTSNSSGFNTWRRDNMPPAINQPDAGLLNMREQQIVEKEDRIREKTEELGQKMERLEQLSKMGKEIIQKNPRLLISLMHEAAMAGRPDLVDELMPPAPVGGKVAAPAAQKPAAEPSKRGPAIEDVE